MVQNPWFDEGLLYVYIYPHARVHVATGVALEIPGNLLKPSWDQFHDFEICFHHTYWCTAKACQWHNLGVSSWGDRVTDQADAGKKHWYLICSPAIEVTWVYVGDSELPSFVDRVNWMLLSHWICVVDVCLRSQLAFSIFKLKMWPDVLASRNAGRVAYVCHSNWCLQHRKLRSAKLMDVWHT